MAGQHGIFIDKSVNTGDVDDSLPDGRIREIIRDRYLRDSTVTIVLAGQETKRRKHVDWEIYSSMIDGKVNKRSGILVINLWGTLDFVVAPRQQEKGVVYPDIASQDWVEIASREDCERRYPHMPARIIDNLLNCRACVSVVPWSRIVNSPNRIRYLIEVAFQGRHQCQYDLSRRMRRSNSSYKRF